MQRAGVRGHFTIHRYCPCQREELANCSETRIVYELLLPAGLYLVVFFFNFT